MLICSCHWTPSSLNLHICQMEVIITNFKELLCALERLEWGINHGYYYFPEKAMAPHSSTLAWKIPWTEEPGRLQSMGSLRVRYVCATSLSLFTFMHWRRKWQATPVFLSGESQDRVAWWAAVYAVVQSWTQLKRLSSTTISRWHWW